MFFLLAIFIVFLFIVSTIFIIMFAKRIPKHKYSTAKICNIGNEILDGNVLNTNSHFLAQKLENKSIRIVEQISIPDNEKTIVRILKKYCDKKTIVILTGGLGPTNDDKTVDAVCQFLKRKAVYEPHSKRRLELLFTRHSSKGNYPQNLQIALRQVRIPRTIYCNKNKIGLAPGIWIPKYQLLCLPGFPEEMVPLWESFETLFLNDLTNSVFLYKKSYSIWCVGESRFMQSIQTINKKSIFQEKKNFNLAIHALPCGIAVNITSHLQSKNSALASLEKKIEEKYQYYNVSNPISSVLEYCQKEQYTISSAESCTGGLIAKCITDAPGVSSIFSGSIVSYSNSIKQDLLKIPKEIIRKHGAVSKECSISMAQNALKILQSDICISTTGIAGPTGGTKIKKVGLVYIAIAHRAKKKY